MTIRANRMLLATLAFITVAIVSTVVIYGQDQGDDAEIASWDFVPLLEQPERLENYSGIDARPTVLGVLYDKSSGPESGVYALIANPNCTGTREHSFGTSCTGNQWSTTVSQFTFD